MVVLADEGRALAIEMLRSQGTLESAAASAGLSVDEARAAIGSLLSERAALGPAEVRTSLAVGAEILRDSRGIPHISADTAEDLFFALGYAEAQDRLWQLDYLRRQAHGRLSEIFGAETLQSDILAKTLDITGVSAASYEELGADSRVATDAFAAGMNAWISKLPAGLPIEFELLGYEPEPWSAIDSLAIQRRWWWYLTGRLNVITTPEVIRAAVGDGDRYSAFFSPDAPLTTIVPPGNYDTANPWPGRPMGAASAGFGSSSFPAGSNNWAAGPSVTTSGNSLLASDPHVYFSVPADWYEVHLKGAGHDAFGVTYPAMPGILIGRNQKVAWGVTNNICSLRDLFIEEVNPDNAGEYRSNGEWVAFAERSAEIAVKGGETYTHTTRIAHGRPVVDHLVPATALPANLWGDSSRYSVLSLAWVGLAPSDETQCLLDVQRATTVEEERQAYSTWRCPTFNMMFADDSGNIGYQAVGSLPLRGRERRGYRFANEPLDVWQGSIPYEGLPRLHNPERGWISSANNQTAPADFPYPLNGTWAPEDRAPRAEHLMKTRQPHSLDGFEKIQMDVHSGRAERGTPGVLSATASLTDPAVVEARDLLGAWDFAMTTDAIGPTLYYVFHWRWHSRVIAQRFSAELLPLAIDSGWGLSAELLHANLADWFASDEERTAGIAAAFGEAVAWLTDKFGPDPSGWTWGKLHRLGAVHPAAKTPIQHEVLDVAPQAHAGGASTLAAAYPTPFGTFDTKLGANYRIVAELGDGAPTRSICWPGQSGHPGSAHYTDQVDSHLTGRYADASMNWSEIEARTESRIRLQPAT